MNATRDISKLSQISLAYWLVKLRITILKYHLWYLCQISLQIMLLPIQIGQKISKVNIQNFVSNCSVLRHTVSHLRTVSKQFCGQEKYTLYHHGLI